jgi:hypothetical protein
MICPAAESGAGIASPPPHPGDLQSPNRRQAPNVRCTASLAAPLPLASQPAARWPASTQRIASHATTVLSCLLPLSCPSLHLLGASVQALRGIRPLVPIHALSGYLHVDRIHFTRARR